MWFKKEIFAGSKRDELPVIADEEKVDIMGLTETWGLDDIMDSEMGTHGCRLHRKDRSVVRNKQGGV